MESWKSLKISVRNPATKPILTSTLHHLRYIQTTTASSITTSGRKKDRPKQDHSSEDWKAHQITTMCSTRMLQKGDTINWRKETQKGGKQKEGQIVKASLCLQDTFKYRCRSKVTTSNLKENIVREVDQLTGIREKPILIIKFDRLSCTIKHLRLNRQWRRAKPILAVRWS